LPIVPNFIEKQLLRLQPQLTPFLDLWGAGSFEAIRLASSLGIFEAVRNGGKSSSEIGNAIDVDARSAKILLDALVPLGYLKEKNGRYSATPVSRSFFSDSPVRMNDIFELYSGLFQFLRSHQQEAVKSGKPQINVFEWFNQNPKMWDLFHSFEMSIAKTIEKDIVSKVKFDPAAKRLLDVGGGHGLYSIMLCKSHPRLNATVFDSPKPLEQTKSIIESEQMTDRVSVQPGDFLVDDLGKGYDVALLFNIIHLFTAEQNLQLLKKVAVALNSGGRIVIFDQLLGGEFGRVLRTAHTFYGLLFLITTGGQVYTFGEVSELLSSSGFARPTKKPIRKAGSNLVFATKAVF
jgi:ubiquinone/menaquinone biosynthesis C-methylase UbiE